MNPKVGVWMHLRMAECLVPFTGHCDLKLVICPRFLNYYILGISLILFEVGIQHLVCECILEWRIVPFHFWSL